MLISSQLDIWETRQMQGSATRFICFSQLFVLCFVVLLFCSVCQSFHGVHLFGWSVYFIPVLYMYRGFSRRPCWRAETMKQFCMKIDLISQGRENVLFLPSNMTAMDVTWKCSIDQHQWHTEYTHKTAPVPASSSVPLQQLSAEPTPPAAVVPLLVSFLPPLFFFFPLQSFKCEQRFVSIHCTRFFITAPLL